MGGHDVGNETTLPTKGKGGGVERGGGGAEPMSWDVTCVLIREKGYLLWTPIACFFSKE